MTEPAVSPKRRRRGGLVLILLLLGLGVAFGLLCGVYTIQPIGALPQGRTAIVWRASGEPFFNSPDAFCLKTQGGVSLLCRGMAMRAAPVDRIIVRLPYMRWAYLRSTDGAEFDR